MEILELPVHLKGAMVTKHASQHKEGPAAPKAKDWSADLKGADISYKNKSYVENSSRKAIRATGLATSVLNSGRTEHEHKVMANFSGASIDVLNKSVKKDATAIMANAGGLGVSLCNCH